MFKEFAIIGPNQRSGWKRSGQILSFVQRSSRVRSHALIRSHFLLKLANQVLSLCLLPRFVAKLRPFLTLLTTIARKTLHDRLRDFHQNFNGRRFSIPRTISFFGIAMRSLKLVDLWHLENHCSHFCVTNPAKLSKRRAQTDKVKSLNLRQLFSRQISISLLQAPPIFTTKSLPLLCAFFDKQCPYPSPNSGNNCKFEGVEAGNINQNVAYIFAAHISGIRAQEKRRQCYNSV